MRRNVSSVCFAVLREARSLLSRRGIEGQAAQASYGHPNYHSRYRVFSESAVASRNRVSFREPHRTSVKTSRTVVTTFHSPVGVKSMGNFEKVGAILDGKLIAGQLLKTMAEDTARLKETTGVVPGLAIVQVGERSDSSVYIRMKTKTAAEVGIAARHVKLSSDITEDDLLDKIEELNRDSNVHGIIVQLPLDCGNRIDVSKATDTILLPKMSTGCTL
ncbi:hypothetical protein RvY_07307-1 [Ramazzottius varieornatus]|uniref:methenyltetrahydrofolate cyclohydrolase n=1 Tax=Ramazzottius varieornatus TaxID=947166 RepID=A0A1D1V1M7_RAMVA|nr:hypothetical protein RvY_07307-1 [Ramazzottius varieornatus]